MFELVQHDSAPIFGNLTVLCDDHNNLWFIGRELASMLGYKNGSRDINSHVDECDRQILTPKSLISIKSTSDVPLEIPVRGLIVVNESGLYDLILRSHQPNARLFQKWVKRVIKEIQTKGFYRQPTAPEPPALPDFSDPVAAARAWADAKESELAAIELAETTQQDNSRLQRVSNDLANQLTDGVTIREFAKQLNGVNVAKVNQYLATRSWLRKMKQPSHLIGHGKHQIEVYDATSYSRDRYLRVIRKGNGWNEFKLVLTRRGLKAMYKLYQQSKLPMRVNWDGKHSHEPVLISQSV